MLNYLMDTQRAALVRWRYTVLPYCFPFFSKATVLLPMGFSFESNYNQNHYSLRCGDRFLSRFLFKGKRKIDGAPVSLLLANVSCAVTDDLREHIEK